jgi:hypothetical protein
MPVYRLAAANGAAAAFLSAAPEMDLACGQAAFKSSAPRLLAGPGLQVVTLTAFLCTVDVQLVVPLLDQARQWFPSRSKDQASISGRNGSLSPTWSIAPVFRTCHGSVTVHVVLHEGLLGYGGKAWLPTGH